MKDSSEKQQRTGKNLSVCVEVNGRFSFYPTSRRGFHHDDAVMTHIREQLS